MEARARTGKDPVSGEQPETSVERRSATRETTWRRAIVTTLGGRARLIQGIALDISTSGLRIRTKSHEAPGTPVSIELAPRDETSSAPPVTVRGRVVWVKPGENGEVELGIRLQLAPLSGPAQPIAGRTEAEALISGLRERIATGEEIVPLTLLRASVVERLLESTTKEEEIPTRRRRRIAPILWLLAGVLLGVLLLILALRLGLGPARVPGAARAQVEVALPPAAALDSAQDALERGEPAVAEALLARVIENASPATVEHFVARVLHADAQRAQQEMGAFARGVAELSLNQPALPPPWRALAEDLRHEAAQLPRLATPGQVGPLFNTVARLQRPHEQRGAPADAPPTNPEIPGAPENLASSRDEGGPVQLEVSKSDYTLSVRRGEAVLAVFPVGLGMDSTTPEGDFVIANKLVDPTWYNNGDPVPPGDPRNPLGNRWMGLGRNGTATSYGIHPTSDADSIGRGESRGCVRMRPGDAVALFAWCGVGTPVRIVP